MDLRGQSRDDAHRRTRGGKAPCRLQDFDALCYARHSLAAGPYAPLSHQRPLAGPGQIPVLMGAGLNQSCDDPLKLAYDPSAGREIVCTRYGTWVSSVNPTAVRSLGAPCPPSEMDSGLVARTPDDHMIMCPSSTGVWSLYKP